MCRVIECHIECKSSQRTTWHRTRPKRIASHIYILSIWLWVNIKKTYIPTFVSIHLSKNREENVRSTYQAMWRCQEKIGAREGNIQRKENQLPVWCTINVSDRIITIKDIDDASQAKSNRIPLARSISLSLCISFTLTNFNGWTHMWTPSRCRSTCFIQQTYASMIHYHASGIRSASAFIVFNVFHAIALHCTCSSMFRRISVCCFFLLCLSCAFIIVIYVNANDSISMLFAYCPLYSTESSPI